MGKTLLSLCLIITPLNAFSSLVETELWQVLEAMADANQQSLHTLRFQNVLRKAMTAELGAMPPWEVDMAAEPEPELPPEARPVYSGNIRYLWPEVLAREFQAHGAARYRVFPSPALETVEDVFSFARRLSPHPDVQFLILLYALEQTHVVGQIVFDQPGAYWLFALNLIARYGHLKWSNPSLAVHVQSFFNQDFLKSVVKDSELLDLAKQMMNSISFVKKVMRNIFFLLEHHWQSDGSRESLEAAVSIVTALYTSPRWMNTLGRKNIETAVFEMLRRVCEELPEIRQWWIEELERGARLATSPYELAQFEKLLSYVRRQPLPRQQDANPWSVLRCEPLFRGH